MVGPLPGPGIELMTRNKRRGWAAAHQDLASAAHGRMSRRHNQIPTSAPDAAARLAAVQAAAATRKHPKKGKIIPMHDAIRKDLVLRLQRLSADERSELMAEAAAENAQAAGKTRAAEALSEFVRPTRKDS